MRPGRLAVQNRLVAGKLIGQERDARRIQVGEELLLLRASAREGLAGLKADLRRACRYTSRKSAALRMLGISARGQVH